MSGYVFLFTIFLSFGINIKVVSQTLPAEGRTLNYRIIGFSFPYAQNANNYRLEIARGYYDKEDSFSKNIVVSLNSTTNKLISEVPAFGYKYTWRVVYTSRHSTTTYGPLHHFATATSSFVDTGNIRLRILKSSDRYKDAYVFADANNALYDMEGHPVWFLPNIDGKNVAVTNAIDLKLTSRGTITLILDKDAYEIAFDGTILWKGPKNKQVNGDTSAQYHHELTRIANGHYMVLTNEFVNVYTTHFPLGDSSLVISRDAAPANVLPIASKITFGTLVELDKNGNVVWSYKTARYFAGSDLIYRKHSIANFDPHDNAFYLDEKKKELYISFKNIDRVIKIKYPEGTILNTYGEIYKPGIPEKGNNLFCTQHSCKLTAEGNLLLINDNNCRQNMPPSVVIMKQPHSWHDTLEKIWEFSSPGEISAKRTGGNVIELPDNSLFVSSCAPYSILYIVNLNKEILWSSLPEMRNIDNKKWEARPQYRASIIANRADLERLIWNQQK